MELQSAECSPLCRRLEETSPVYEENAESNIGKQGRFQRNAENCFS